MAIEVEVEVASEAVSEATEAEAEEATNRTMVLQQQSKVSIRDPHKQSKVTDIRYRDGYFPPRDRRRTSLQFD